MARMCVSNPPPVVLIGAEVSHAPSFIRTRKKVWRPPCTAIHMDLTGRTPI